MKRSLPLFLLCMTLVFLAGTARAADEWARRYQLKRLALLGYAIDAPDAVLLRTNDSGVYQLYSLDLKTGKRVQLTHEPSGRASGEISPDGRWVYYLKDDHGGETGGLVRVPFGGGPEETLTSDLPPFGIEGMTFDRSGATVVFAASDANGYRFHRLKDGKRTQLYTSQNEAYAPSLSADGKLVSLIETERKNNRHFAALILDASNGARLAELFDGDPNRVDVGPWSPLRGDERVIIRSDRSGFARPGIYDLHKHKRIDFDIKLPGSLVATGWSPDARSLLLSQEVDGRRRLYLYKIATGQLTAVTTPEGMLSRSSIRPDGKIWTTYESAAVTARLFEIDGAGRVTVKLASEEPPPGTPLTSIHFPGARGDSVHAFLGLPKQRNGAAVVYVHGGPRGTTSDSFSPSLQAFLDAGYVVLAPNYHGSDGFGRDFGESIVGDPMRLELEDFAAARRRLVDEGLAQANLIFVTGWSYGGYSTLACLTQQPDDWAGGMAGVAIADVLLQYEEARESLRGWTITNFGGTPKEKGALMRERSPITYAERLKAPLLIIQGKHDSRTPPRQIQEFEKRLAELKKDFSIRWFDAGHGSFSIAEEILDQKMTLDFFDDVIGRVRLDDGGKAAAARSGN
jgi:dipeptidyl aminopeptidase/acylaminoacyl peptidase